MTSIYGLRDCLRLELQIKRYADDLILLYPQTQLTENAAHAALRLDGHTVLVVDDVMFRGHSMLRAVEYLASRPPAWIRTVVPVDRGAASCRCAPASWACASAWRRPTSPWIEALKESVKASLMKYVDLARRLGFPSDYRFEIGTDAVEGASLLCEKVAEGFPKSTVFTGKLIFHRVLFFHRLLHNETAFAIQRRLQWNGITTVILPSRVRV